MDLEFCFAPAVRNIPGRNLLQRHQLAIQVMKCSRQTVYYDGRLYWYQFDGFDNPLEEGFELAGTVEEVFTKEYPSSEYGGTRVEAGQEIYANPIGTVQDLCQI